MPPVHFDGLRDYIVSRRPSGAPWRYFAGNDSFSTRGCPIFRAQPYRGDTLYWIEKRNSAWSWYAFTIEPSGLTAEITISKTWFDKIKDSVDYRLFGYMSNIAIYEPYYQPSIIINSNYAGGVYWHIYFYGNILARRNGFIFPCPLELDEAPLIANGTSGDSNPLTYSYNISKKKCNLDNDCLSGNPSNKKIFDRAATIIDPPNRSFGQYAMATSSPNITHSYTDCSIVNQSTFSGQKHLYIITDKRCSAPVTPEERVAFFAITGVDYRLRSCTAPLQDGVVIKDDVVRIRINGSPFTTGIYQCIVPSATTYNWGPADLVGKFVEVSEAVFQIMAGKLSSYVDWEYFSYDDPEWDTKYSKPIYGMSMGCVGWPSSDETLLLTNLNPSGQWYHIHGYNPSISDYPWFINSKKAIFSRADRT